MKEMLLFGAGASQEAGVPTAYSLTQHIANEFRNQPHLKRHSRVVSFVLGGLLFNRGIQGEDPLACGVNVEEFFNAIQLLADRNTLEASPFVGSWHSMVEELDKIPPSTPHPDRLQEIIFKNVTGKIIDSLPTSFPSFASNDIDRKLNEIIRKSIEESSKGRSFGHYSSHSGLGREVSDFVRQLMKDWFFKLKNARPSSFEFEREFKLAIDQQPKPGEGRVFREVADRMIAMLVKFVYVQESARVSHLAPLKHLVARQPRLTIATLNYDNCVELFCDSAGILCETGIDEWSNTGEFNMQGDGIFLIKLHGSIDWQSSEGQCPERPMPHKAIARISPEEVLKENHWPAVIFGHRNKLTAEGPFLDLLRSFQRELAAAQRLTIVGYSFADVHINVYLSHWLNSNRGNRLRLVEPNFKGFPNPYLRDLIQCAGSQLEVVTKKAGEALTELFGAESLDASEQPV